MDVLVLGSGAREHALAWRLSRDDGVRLLRIAPGNGGTPAVAETIDELDVTDPVAVARHATRERYDLVVIGPEAPLAAGVADALRTASVPVFGPSRAAARLETSKAFAKEQMRRAGIPTAASATFADVDAALAHVRTLERPPVVKADWLAAGKGVVVAEDGDEAERAIRTLLDGARPGGRLLIEERLDGREVSAFALVSDQAVVPLGAACDYKRLGDGDTGPNTGGMGSYTPVPWFGTRELEEAAGAVFEPIAWRMARDDTPYRGVLYAGLMLTASGPMVLEFNARFGDPEAQVLLPMLDGQLASALLGTAMGDRGLMEGTLGQLSGAAVGVVLASEGYPDAPVTGRPLSGAEPASRDDRGPRLCFHTATRGSGGGYVTSGGRVATFVGLGDDLGAAREAAYAGARDARL
ncbi:MAG TPA: phosphoribosylamine--glycine ligase, partial [Candidatus Limnocylindria bacterium]|nr:phosphoribosylamine--glycine ligase [Candidatus Limnocylindria bacterium]